MNYNDAYLQLVVWDRCNQLKKHPANFKNSIRLI